MLQRKQKIVLLLIFSILILIVYANYFSKRSNLFNAIEKGDLEKVKDIIEKGTKIDILSFKRRTPLVEALRCNHYDIAKFLIDCGANINSQTVWPTALCIAVYQNNEEAARFILSNGANADLVDKNGYTPLMTAAMIESGKMLQFLIENGSDINYQGNNGDTALHIAIGSNFYKGAVILVNNGANINKVNDDGETPLKQAMKYNYKKIAELLREHGAKEVK